MKQIKIFLILAHSYAVGVVAQNVNCTSTALRNNLLAINTATNGSNWTIRWNTTAAQNTWFGVRFRNTSLNELQSLKLPNNNLTGSLPINLTQLCPFMDSLDLSRNSLSGTIPAAIGNLTGLSYLSLANNNLTGQIPASIINFWNLVTLDLGNNKLTNIPSQLGSLYYRDVDVGLVSQIRVIRLDSNEIVGSIPRLDTLNRLLILDLSNNKLTGQVQPMFSQMRNLAILDLSKNDLSILDNRFWSSINSTNSLLLDISQNRFTFEDLIPNMALKMRTKEFTYAPQKDICQPKTYDLMVGDGWSIKFGIDDGIRDNEYRWYKDGKLIDKTNVNYYSLQNLTACAAGVYECRVTNPSVPALTLYCRDQILQVSAPPCEKELSVDISPNPTTSQVTIQFKAVPYEGRFLQVTNMLGQVVLTKELTEPELLWDGAKLDCQNWGRGLYILSLHTEGGQILEQKRFLKL
jgi:hypothetical protein